MANALYDKAREQFLLAGINWDTASFKAVLVDSANYTVDLTTHTSLADIAAGARISASVALVNTLVLPNGAADADDTTFTSVTGSSIEALVIYLDTGTENTSTLIAYIDTATGLPITPNSGDIIVTWDNGTNKIFRL